jgi:methyltransferase (TIGR00027 family)
MLFWRSAEEHMDKAQASRTAVSVALRRAVHQLRDQPLVLHDPVAIPLLGQTYAAHLQAAVAGAGSRFSLAMRAHLVARSRYAEDGLAAAVARGVPQYVLLGAGLDTFAYRNPFAHLRVFEVDHPATQQWKRALLARANIAMPENLTFAPVDFEQHALPERLQAAGFDPHSPAIFAWLGVVPYLTLAAFRATMGFIAAQAPGSGVIFDYGQPRSALNFLQRLAWDALAARVKASGEPFRLFFTPQEVATELSAFRNIEDLGAAELNARYFSGRSDKLALRSGAGRLLSAWL